jgi:glyoxylase-like metal-dependent hydrolase (beta-lactamase superfamily II)
MKPRLEAFIARSGARIYRIPLHLFPELWGFAHLVVSDEVVALVDVGSGFGESNQQLEDGFQRVRTEYGEPIDWTDVTHILITHAHIDHFGGLHYVRERTSAPIGVHELDQRVLTRYEERVATAARRLGAFFSETGITEDETQDLLDLYLLGKQLFSSTEVDFTFEAAGMRIGALEFTHVPGHAPGQIVIRIGEILLAADHILPEISPHIAPERLTLNTGLGHYLESLMRTRPMAEQIRLVLGGHQRPFADLAGRIDEIWELYRERLDRVLSILDQGQTVAEISDQIFGETAGYHRLLALEEAGAYVEYLHQRGYLKTEAATAQDGRKPPAIRYQRAVEVAHTIPHALDIAASAFSASQGSLDRRT